MRFCPHLNFRDGAALFSEATFDRRDRAFVVEHLAPGGVFLDVGANMGIYALTLASRRPDARVYAFEPIADVAARLQFNVPRRQTSTKARCSAACDPSPL